MKSILRAIAVGASVCCLGGTVAGITVFALNSRLNVQAVDTAYNSGSGSSSSTNQQYVIRFKEPTGVTFSLQTRGRAPFSKYCDQEASQVQAALQYEYGVLDIKKFEHDIVPEAETWYDVALDESTITGKDNFFEFYCKYDSTTVSSIAFTYDADSTESLLGIEEAPQYYIEITDWDEGTSNGHLPVVTAIPTYKMEKYSVTCQAGDGNFVFTGDKTATEGSNYNFTVTARGGYTVSSVTYDMGELEGQSAEGEGGSYVIENVNGNITIYVETKPIQNKVTFSQSDGYHFATDNVSGVAVPEAMVDRGGSLTFYLYPEEGWSIADAKVYCSGVNGALPATVSDGYNSYTISSVSSDVTITVNGVVKKPFTVRGIDGDGYTVTDNMNHSPTEGSTYQFSVKVTKEGYEVKTVQYTMGAANEQQIEAVNGIYTILNVTGDITLKVTLEAIQFSLTFPSDMSGYKIYDWTGGAQGDELSGAVIKSYKELASGALKFKIEVQPGYKGEPTVTFVSTSGASDTISKGDDGVYTLNVRSHGTISVRGITQEVYDVTVEGAEDMTNYHYAPSGSTTGLTYGTTFNFTVTADDGYLADGYEVKAHKTDVVGESIPVTPSAGQKKTTNFSVSVTGSITLTFTQKAGDHREKKTVKYFDGHENYKVQIKVSDEFTDLDEKDGTTVSYNDPLTFKIVADGYTVVSVQPTSSHETITKEYLIEHVTENVNISAYVRENALTVVYLSATGSQIGAPQSILYSKLDQTVLNDVNTVDPAGYHYILKEWYRGGSKFATEQFSGTAKEAIKDAPAEWHLQLHYSLDVEKAQGLLNTFYAYYRNDSSSADNWENSYFIYRMEIDGADWKSFLSELNTLGSATLSAVGFTYTNSSKLSSHGIDDFTEADIAEHYGDMIPATDLLQSGHITSVDKTANDDSGAELWLFGFKWDPSDDQENQVQFISNVKPDTVRHFGGWFMVTINGEKTVIMAKNRVTYTTDDTTKAPKDVALAPAKIKIEVPENDEEPTIE